MVERAVAYKPGALHSPYKPVAATLTLALPLFAQLRLQIKVLLRLQKLRFCIPSICTQVVCTHGFPSQKRSFCSQGVCTPIVDLLANKSFAFVRGSRARLRPYKDLSLQNLRFCVQKRSFCKHSFACKTYGFARKAHRVHSFSVQPEQKRKHFCLGCAAPPG